MICHSKSDYAIFIPTSNAWEVLLLYILAIIWYCQVFSWILIILIAVCFGHKLFIRYMFWKYFLLMYDLSFYSFNNIFCRAEVFHFNEVQLTNCFLLILYLRRCSRFFPLISSGSFIVLCLTFRSVI